MRRRDGPRPEVLLALCGAGFLLLNFPLLLVWDQPLTVLCQASRCPSGSSIRATAATACSG